MRKKYTKKPKNNNFKYNLNEKNTKKSLDVLLLLPYISYNTTTNILTLMFKNISFGDILFASQVQKVCKKPLVAIRGISCIIFYRILIATYPVGRSSYSTYFSH